jgi:hypothetical protein
VNAAVSGGSHDGDKSITVPIEQGVSGADGIRYFPQPFGSLGASQTIMLGSAMNDGQVVPIQATIGGSGGGSGSVPSAPGEVEPPSIFRTPPSYGHALSCALGSWTGRPTLTNIWVLSSYQLRLTGSKLGSSFTTVLT